MRRNIQLITMLVILSPLTVGGQALYNKLVSNGSPKLGNQISRLSDGNFLTLISPEVFFQEPTQFTGGFTFLLKTDTAGDKIFFTAYHSNPTNETFKASDFIELPGGDIILTGTFDDMSATFRGIWVTRLNSLGNEIWTKRFSGGTSPPSCFNYGTQVFDLPNGNLLVAGGYQNIFPAKKGNAFYELSPLGGLVNIKYRETGKAMSQSKGWMDSSGKIYFPYNHLGFMVRDSAGLFPGHYNIEVAGYSDTTTLRKTIEGHGGDVILLATGFNSTTGSLDVSLTSFDTSGTFQWMHTYNTPLNEYAWDVIKTDAGYLLTAFQRQVPPYGHTLFIFTDQSGTVQNSFISADEGVIVDVAKTDVNQLALTGMYYQLNIAGTPYTNLALIVSDNTLSNLCLAAYTVTDSACTPSAFNNGIFNMDTPLSYSMIQELPSALPGAVYNGLDACGTVGIAEHDSGGLMVFPNPVLHSFQLSGTHADGRIHIYDISGRMVKDVHAQENATHVDAHELPDGVYMVEYLNSNSYGSVRIMKFSGE